MTAAPKCLQVLAAVVLTACQPSLRSLAEIESTLEQNVAASLGGCYRLNWVQDPSEEDSRRAGRVGGASEAIWVQLHLTYSDGCEDLTSRDHAKALARVTRQVKHLTRIPRREIAAFLAVSPWSELTLRGGKLVFRGTSRSIDVHVEFLASVVEKLSEGMNPQLWLWHRVLQRVRQEFEGDAVDGEDKLVEPTRFRLGRIRSPKAATVMKGKWEIYTLHVVAIDLVSADGIYWWRVSAEVDGSFADESVNGRPRPPYSEMSRSVLEDFVKRILLDAIRVAK